MRPFRQCNFGESMLVRVADDDADPGQGREFFGGTLGIAPRHNDAGFRILALDPANGGAGILIGCGSHSARVQNHDRSLRGRGCAGKPALLELAFEGGAIRLRGAATEVFYVKSGHVTMLAQSAVNTGGNAPLLG